MSNSYYDMTGELVLNNVTPVIKALFKVFELKENYPNQGQTFIKEIAESTDCTWPTVIENLQSLAKENGIQLPESDDDELAGEDVLFALATFYKADDNTDLANYIDHCTFEDDVSVSELFFLAGAFDDGHGLRQFSTEAAWHSDRHSPGNFGGFAQFNGLHVSYANSTTDDLTVSAAVEQALASGNTEEAADQVWRHAQRFLTGIINPTEREQITALIAKKLLA